MTHSPYGSKNLEKMYSDHVTPLPETLYWLPLFQNNPELPVVAYTLPDMDP